MTLRKCTRCRPLEPGRKPALLPILHHVQEALTETPGQYNRHVLVPQFGLRAPNIDAKPVVSAAGLEVLLVFNMAYDESIFPSERHRIQLPCCYKIMCYTGARPGELVDNERRKPKDGSTQKLFGSKVVSSPNANCEADEDEDNDVAPDEVSRRLDELLSAEPKSRGRPKALCYEDIHLMIVRHPRTGRAVPAMAIKFIHHKGADNRPKPWVANVLQADHDRPIFSMLTITVPSSTSRRRGNSFFVSSATSSPLRFTTTPLPRRA